MKEYDSTLTVTPPQSVSWRMPDFWFSGQGNKLGSKVRPPRGPPVAHLPRPLAASARRVARSLRGSPLSPQVPGLYDSMYGVDISVEARYADVTLVKQTETVSFVQLISIVGSYLIFFPLIIAFAFKRSERFSPRFLTPASDAMLRARAHWAATRARAKLHRAAALELSRMRGGAAPTGTNGDVPGGTTSSGATGAGTEGVGVQAIRPHRRRRARDRRAANNSATAACTLEV